MAAGRERLAIGILRALPRERLSRVFGVLSDWRAPRWLVGAVLRSYIRHYRVDLSEAVIPAAGFATFNDFFTRALVAGARAIDPAADAVVSPADGRLDDAGPIDPGRRFQVKGRDYDLGELLGSDREAGDFAGGSFAIVYLSPRDYHRVHAPVAGRVEHVRHLPGTLYPVNELGVRNVPRLLAVNERVAIRLATACGPVVLVMVGAMIVGRVRLFLPAPQRPPLGGPPAERAFAPDQAPAVDRGAEIGAFELGSTAVVLLPPGGVLEPWPAGRPIRVGQRIARLPAPTA